MAYSITVWVEPDYRSPRVVFSDQILAKLDRADPEHARHVARIEQIEREGIRYSGEAFDVLSAALDAAGGLKAAEA